MQSESQNQLSEEQRKEVFLALVEAQDQMMPVPDSRRLVGGRFEISEYQVKIIEREGIDKKWPPLMEAAS